MHSEYTFLGDFKGKFFTLQAVVLENSEPFPVSKQHAVKVYAGELSNAQYQHDYKPEQYRKLESFSLLNVPKIEITPKGQAPFQDKRVYNFTQLLLIEPKVVRTYEINGKTYGEIESKAYGKTERYPLVDKIGPDLPPLQVDETHIGSDADYYGDDGSAPIQKHLRGCFDNFWRILLYLFLAWLLFALMKSCNSQVDQCALRDLEEQALEREKKIRDTVKKEYEENLPLAMSAISKVYFFKNSTDFEISALGNIPRLYNVIKYYPDKHFIIEGHHSGKDLETMDTIDLKRAEKMRDTLVQMGIPPKRLSVTAMGDKKLIDNTRKMSVTYLPGGVEREYNQNMRVEVKWEDHHE